jgi:hypothetical protein
MKKAEGRKFRDTVPLIFFTGVQAVMIYTVCSLFTSVFSTFLCCEQYQSLLIVQP